MQVDLIAWAMCQSLPKEQHAVLALMALLAAEANTGALYLGNLTALAVCLLMPMPLVQHYVGELQTLGLIVPFHRGYQLQAGVLAA